MDRQSNINHEGISYLSYAKRRDAYIYRCNNYDNMKCNGKIAILKESGEIKLEKEHTCYGGTDPGPPIPSSSECIPQAHTTSILANEVLSKSKGISNNPSDSRRSISTATMSRKQEQPSTVSRQNCLINICDSNMKSRSISTNNSKGSQFPQTDSKISGLTNVPSLTSEELKAQLERQIERKCEKLIKEQEKQHQKEKEEVWKEKETQVAQLAQENEELKMKMLHLQEKNTKEEQQEKKYQVSTKNDTLSKHGQYYKLEANQSFIKQFELSNNAYRTREIVIEEYKEETRLVIKGKNHRPNKDQYCSLTIKQWNSFCQQYDEITKAFETISITKNAKQKLFKIDNKDLTVENYDKHPFVKITGTTSRKRLIVTLNLVDLKKIATLKEQINKSLNLFQQQLQQKVLYQNQKHRVDSASMEDNENENGTGQPNTAEDYTKMKEILQDQQQQNKKPTTATKDEEEYIPPHCQRLLDQKDERIRYLEQQVADLKQQLIQQEASFKNQLKEQQDNFKLQLKEQKQQFEQRLKQQKEEFEERLKAQEISFKEQLERQENYFKQQLKEQKEIFTEQLNRKDDEIRRRDEDIKKWYDIASRLLTGQSNMDQFKEKVTELSQRSQENSSIQSPVGSDLEQYTSNHNHHCSFIGSVNLVDKQKQYESIDTEVEQSQGSDRNCNQQAFNDQKSNHSQYCEKEVQNEVVGSEQKCEEQQQELQQDATQFNQSDGLHQNQNQDTQMEEALQENNPTPIKLQAKDSSTINRDTNTKQAFYQHESVELLTKSFHISHKETPKTVSLTYGDLTTGSFSNILKQLTAIENPYYKLDKHSKFLDMGSGTGALCYHCTFQIGCHSHGIEHDCKRVEVADSFLRKEYKRRYGEEKLCDIVSFQDGDITQWENLNGFTHIYSFNPTWPDETMEPLIQILNRTNFRVLVWCKKPKDCQGLKQVESYGQTVCKNTGGGSHTFYFYRKLNQTKSEVTEQNQSTPIQLKQKENMDKQQVEQTNQDNVQYSDKDQMQIDEEFPNKEFQFINLQNRGNTCYLNSSLQLLSFYVWEGYRLQLFSRDGGLEMYKHFWPQKQSNFNYKQQRDSAEAFIDMCERLHQLDYLDSSMVVTNHCRNCSTSSKSTVKHIISLSITKKSLSDNLKSFMTQEDLIEEFKCDQCNQQNVYQSISQIGCQDAVLIQLKRFHDKSKLSDKIHCENRIQMKDLRQNQCTYHLGGYVSHIGDKLRQGHYVTCINLENKWYCHDDLHYPKSWLEIGNIQEENLRQQAYYLIYYKERNQHGTKSFPKVSLVGPKADADGNPIYASNTTPEILVESCKKFTAQVGINVYDKQLEGDLYKNQRLNTIGQSDTGSKEQKLSNLQQDELIVNQASIIQQNNVQQISNIEALYICYRCLIFEKEKEGKENAKISKQKVFENQELLRIHQQDVGHSGAGLVLDSKTKGVVNVIGVQARTDRNKILQQVQEDQQMGKFKLSKTDQSILQDKILLGKRSFMNSSIKLDQVLTDDDNDIQDKSSLTELSIPSNPRCRRKKQLGGKRTRRQMLIEGKKKTQGREIRNQQTTSIVDFLTKSEGVQQYIVDFDKVFDEFFSKEESQHQDGDKFDIVGRLFTDGFKVKKSSYFSQIKEPMKWLEMEIKHYFSVRVVKDSGKDGEKSYFVRLNDEVAKIDEEFILKFKLMLQDIRKKIQLNYQKQDQNLSDKEAQTLAQEFFVQQFDHTSHLKGMIYVIDNLKEVIVELGKDLQEYDRATSNQFKSSKSCLQLIQKTEKKIKQRLKFYNKFPLHLLQTEALDKFISMGLKTVLYGSSDFIYILEQCKGHCLSRMEFSEIFNTFEEEEAFFNKKNLTLYLQRLHRDIVGSLNKSSQLPKIYKNAGMEEVLDTFFEQVKHTVIIRTADECAIIYGFNSDTKKYYGLLDKVPYGRTLEELAIYHQLPASLGVCYQLYDKGRYDKIKYKKDPKKGEVQFPIRPLYHYHKQEHQLDFLGFDKHGFVYAVNKQRSAVTLIDSFSNTSNHQMRVFNRKMDNNIYERYKQHNAAAVQFSDVSVCTQFNLFAWNKGKLIAYCDLRRIKCRSELSKEEFLQLKSHLIGQGFKHRNNICVKAKDGIKNKELQQLLDTLDELSQELNDKDQEEGEQYLKQWEKKKRQRLGTLNSKEHLKRRRANIPVNPSGGGWKVFQSETNSVVGDVVEDSKYDEEAKQDIFSTQRQRRTSRLKVQSENIASNKVLKNEIEFEQPVPPVLREETKTTTKVVHPKITHEGFDFRFKSKISSSFLQYECLNSKKGCKANLKVSLSYIPTELRKEHTC